jgi:hypothetical protein
LITYAFPTSAMICYWILHGQGHQHLLLFPPQLCS